MLSVIFGKTSKETVAIIGKNVKISGEQWTSVPRTEAGSVSECPVILEKYGSWILKPHFYLIYKKQNNLSRTGRTKKQPHLPSFSTLR